MTDAFDKANHQAAHEGLHQYLDELVADMIRHVPGMLPNKTTVLELMQWSAKQAQEPDHPDHL